MREVEIVSSVTQHRRVLAYVACQPEFVLGLKATRFTYCIRGIDKLSTLFNISFGLKFVRPILLGHACLVVPVIVEPSLASPASIHNRPISRHSCAIGA